MAKEYRGWAICDDKGRPFFHSVAKTKAEVCGYAARWCSGRNRWLRVCASNGYTIRRVAIRLMDQPAKG